LVVVFLLYKRPEQTRQGLVKGFSIVIGFVIILLGVVALINVMNVTEDEWRSWELAKVVVTASYDAVNCPTEKPLHVNIENRSSKTVKAVSWDLEAYVPVHSTNLIDYADYKSDTILKPNQFVSYCYPPPKLNANVDPALLECKIAHPYVTFAEAQGD
jgi:hypothetical protein